MHRVMDQAEKKGPSCLGKAAYTARANTVTVKYREYESNYRISDVQKNFWGATEEMPPGSMAQRCQLLPNAPN
jgi:hypothetical protein